MFVTSVRWWGLITLFFFGMGILYRKEGYPRAGLAVQVKVSVGGKAHAAANFCKR